jgi:histidinol-phosphate phosphatase family protein
MTRLTVEEVYDAAIKQVPVSGSGSRRLSMTESSDVGLTGVTVLLDRDGTLNRDIGYVTSPDELELFPGIAGAVAGLNRAGARVALITNQSGIARGLFTTEILDSIHARLRTELKAGGAVLDGIYYCPHHPDHGCACRKPGTALVDRAFGELGGDRSACYMVGDQKRDVELARKIGARSVLVTSGPTSRESLAALQADGLPPDHVAAGLVEAVEWIFKDAARLKSSRTSVGA